MILVDVFVPSLNKNYEFQLDENVCIEFVIEEITEMICNKEHCRIVGNKEDLYIGKYQSKSMLDKTMTLSEINVSDGDRLILV